MSKRCCGVWALALLMLWAAGCQGDAGPGVVTSPTFGPPPTLTAALTAPPTATSAASATPAPAKAATASPAPPTAPPSATATPSATAAGSPTAGPTLRLLFTGDINPGRCPAQVALAHNDFTRPYHVVGEVLRAADLTIGSLDGSLSDQSPPSPCPETMNLIGPSRTVEGLVYAGFDLLTVATNHAKDCGVLGWNCHNRAFFDTLRHLDAAGVLAVGGGPDLAAARAPVIIERAGVRLAFLAATQPGPETWAAEDRPGTAPLSAEAMPDLLDDIARARQQADVVIVLPQWGTEYTEMPDPDVWAWAGQMVEAGATLVVGNHPHLLQPVEVFAGPDGGPRALVAYALGNFVFDQGPWRTRQGAVLEVVLQGAALAEWRLLPTHIRSLHQPHWAEPAEAQAVLQRLEAAAEALPER